MAASLLWGLRGHCTFPSIPRHWLLPLPVLLALLGKPFGAPALSGAPSSPFTDIIMGNILSNADFSEPLINSLTPRYGDTAAQLLAQDYMAETFAKGLATTGAQAVDGTTGADALKVQDLTKQIAVAELQVKDHAIFWNWVRKVPAFSDVLEKTVLDDWGGIRRGGFINKSLASGGMTNSDPSLTRGTLQVQWMGGRYQVFRTALATRGMSINADPVTGSAEEVSSTARYQQLLLQANELCYFGDPDKNAFEPEGVIKQIQDRHDGRWICRYDMKGQPFNATVLPDIEEILRSKGGIWTDLFWSPKAFADMRKSMIQYIRTQAGGSIPMGTYTKEAIIMDLAGNEETAKLHTDLFLDPLDEPTVAEGPNPPQAPASVTIGYQAATPNGLGRKMDAGVFGYAVDAVGINGRSSVTVAATNAAPNGTQDVVLTITNAGGNNVGDVAFFEVYRRTSTMGQRKYVGRVKANALAGGQTVFFVDNGEVVPGCSNAIALTNRQVGIAGSEVMVRQLFTPQKVRLPNDVMAEQAAWLLSMVPQLLTPHFCLSIENVGRL